MDDLDITQYIQELESKDMSQAFEDFKFSDVVLDNDNLDLSSMLDEHTKENEDHYPFDTLPSTPMDNNTIIHANSFDDELDQSLNYNLYEEIMVSDETQQVMSQIPDPVDLENTSNPFHSIADNMSVKEQPKADQRARYESDGPRFLPDSKKHPMSIQLPDLSSKSLAENEVYGTILTIVTSTHNPKEKTFVHVNGIKYRTNEAIEIGHGSIFLPITTTDIKNSEKSFPRLSIICKKFDEYSFDLTTFDPSTSERITEKYTLINEDSITQAAKGKQFTNDYDLLCYKIVFQLAFKRHNNIFVSHIKCETNIINEQKTPLNGVKRKASLFKKRKGSIDVSTLNPAKKSKPLISSDQRSVIHLMKRSKKSSVDSF